MYVNIRQSPSHTIAHSAIIMKTFMVSDNPCSPVCMELQNGDKTRNVVVTHAQLGDLLQNTKDSEGDTLHTS